MSFQASAESRKGEKKDQKIWMVRKLSVQMKQEPRGEKGKSMRKYQIQGAAWVAYSSEVEEKENTQTWRAQRKAELIVVCPFTQYAFQKFLASLRHSGHWLVEWESPGVWSTRSIFKHYVSLFSGVYLNLWALVFFFVVWRGWIRSLSWHNLSYMPTISTHSQLMQFGSDLLFQY